MAERAAFVQSGEKDVEGTFTTFTLSTITWKEVVAGWGSVSSPRKQTREKVEMDLNCFRENLDWILGKKLSQSVVKHLNKLPRGVWGHHCWRCLKDVQMWVSGSFASTGLKVRIHNLRSLYQTK